MLRLVSRLHRPIRHNGQQLLPASLKKAICSALVGEPVCAAYVYGSHARGQADAQSDVDVALLAESALTSAERFDLRLRVTNKLLCRLDEAVGIDVIVLQTVPLLLQYNVVRNSVLVLEKDAAARRSFELGVERRYDDERPYLDRETDLILDRILGLHS